MAYIGKVATFGRAGGFGRFKIAFQLDGNLWIDRSMTQCNTTARDKQAEAQERSKMDTPAFVVKESIQKNQRKCAQRDDGQTVPDQTCHVNCAISLNRLIAQ